MSLEPAVDRVLNRRRLSPDEVRRRPADDSAASRALFAWYAPGFSDRLGDRLNLFDNTDGPPLELLRLRAEFSRAPDFEFSLRARVGELRDFEHPRFARVCRADRLPEPGGGLALVSERSDGIRLSDALRLAETRRARLTAGLLLPIVADATDALAALHARGPHTAHGAVGTDRLVIAPRGRVLVTEYVLGSALRGLAYSRAAFWRHLRVALPAASATPSIAQSTDVFQVGLVALALAASRVLDADEDLDRLPPIIEEAARRVPGAGWDGRWPAFERWLRRALHLEGDAFGHAGEAAAALAPLVAQDDRRAAPARGGWDEFVSDCEAPPILTGRTVESRAALPPPPPPAAGGLEPPRDTRLRTPAPDLDGWERRSAPPSASSAPKRTDDDEGHEEHAPAASPGPTPPPAVGRTWRVTTVAIAVALMLAVLSGGVAIGAWFFANGERTAQQTGSLHVNSNPPGVLVAVNGAPAGRTPVRLALAPGSHVVELANGASRRTLPVTLAAGATLSHFVEMPAAASTLGRLQVTTEPAGLHVIVDGTPRGSSPLVIDGLASGPHTVTVEGRGRTSRQVVEITGGATAALFVPLATGPGTAPGWLSVTSPVELQVYEDGELLGTSRSARIMLPAGRHEIELVNEELGVWSTKEVNVRAGGTAIAEIELPQGRMDVNALPWAEVWLDGDRVGETPLGSVPARVGRHVLTFRHPQLGERRVECLVTTGHTTRVGVDLRK